MESRIDLLLKKYWSGETSIDEEAELKDHFKENPAITTEGQYFRGLQKMKEIDNTEFQHPSKSSQRTKWSVAAAVTVGLITAATVFQDAREQRQYVVDDPQEAYAITKKALLMVSSGIKEGKQYSKQITKINKAEELLIEN